MRRMFPVLCFLVGVVVGSFGFGARSTKAQLGGTVYITEHDPPFTGTHSVNITGKQAISMSCVQKSSGEDCYILSQ